MLEWFSENAGVVANFATLAMLFVWLFYTMLFYRDFKRQRSPLLVIHQAQGHDLESTCLLVNLSKEPIHVLCVMMVAHTANGPVTQRVTSLQRVSREQDTHWKFQDFIKQGPLPTGYFLALGTFHDMLQAAGLLPGTEIAITGTTEREWHTLAETIREVEVRVIALHGAYPDPIGAYRTFHVDAAPEGLEFRPSILLTRQMVARRERRQVRQWLLECLPPGAR